MSIERPISACISANSGRDENGHNIAQPWPRGINFFASSNEYNRLSSQKISERLKKTFIERNGRTIGRNLDDLGSPGVKARLSHLLKEAKPGSPIVTEEVTQLCNSILKRVNVAEVVFALSKKGPKSPEEKKSEDDNKDLKDAFVSAKATQLRKITSGER